MVSTARRALVSGPVVGILLVALLAAVSTLNRAVDAVGEPPDVAVLQQLMAGAHSVVVGKARSVRGAWQDNEHGDRIIQSIVELDVDETLKGRPERSRRLQIEGGTVDGVTLEVSGEPDVRVGERVVMFLHAGSPQIDRVLGGEQGVLALDDRDFVRGTSLRLEELRQYARGQGR